MLELSTSAGGRKSRGELGIEVPGRNFGEEPSSSAVAESQASQGFRSPMSRMLSFNCSNTIKHTKMPHSSYRINLFVASIVGLTLAIEFMGHCRFGRHSFVIVEFPSRITCGTRY
ncbi:unnamed protein product [Linum trigynum]|uniref:Uncharacterized protein n=1 Tax=Linum trigynum TaxID=586398 RepID=A0AAV2E211_9ROSI